MMTTDPKDPLEGEIKKSRLKVKQEQGYFIGESGYKNSVINIVKLIEDDEMLNGLWRYNEFTDRIEYNRTPSWNNNIKEGKAVTDGDEVHIKGYFANKHHFEPSVSLIREGLFLASSKNSIHPVKSYLESLEHDGEERLNTWLCQVTGAEKNEYSVLIGRKLICSMIKRIYEPGCQLDNMIVFEGKQGIYKTTMLKVLGGKWYAPLIIMAQDKDTVDCMLGKWLLEVEEMSSMRHREADHMKAFISRTTDRVRLSYRRNTDDFERRCVIVGTMNPSGNNQYFKDDTGNRRFWPVECEKNIDISWLKEHRDQLFAEGMILYKDENLFLDDNNAIAIALSKQEERRPVDSWLSIIDDWLISRDVVKLEEILGQCLSIDKEKMNHSHTIRVGICMRTLGWRCKRLGTDHKTIYIRPDMEFKEMTKAVESVSWDE